MLILGKEACKSNRYFQVPKIGVADDKVAQYAGLHYYVDKDLQVQSENNCKLACEVENEFLCRSYLYRGPPIGTAYNCHLFHLDHWTLPDGSSTYLNAERPLIDNGERVGTYYENVCESQYSISSQCLTFFILRVKISIIGNFCLNNKENNDKILKN